DSIHPGVKALEIHKIAVSKFSELDYSCTHNTGHGMGLQTWERPFISLHDQTILQPNMFIAIEQTIEKPLEYGIRFEDNIFVTDNSYQNCIEFPMELIEI
ncbi:MAG: M24 family metallopeptidase, partial [Candidatus Hodarchaeota archaeon]